MTRPAGRSGAASVRGPLAKASRPESEPGCCPYSKFARASSYAAHVSADACSKKVRASRFAARCVNTRGIRKFLGFGQVWGLGRGFGVWPTVRGCPHPRIHPHALPQRGRPSWSFETRLLGAMGQGYSRDPAQGVTGERLRLQRLCIVIPTLNEAGNIAECIHR